MGQAYWHNEAVTNNSLTSNKPNSKSNKPTNNIMCQYHNTKNQVANQPTNQPHNSFQKESQFTCISSTVDHKDGTPDISTNQPTYSHQKNYQQNFQVSKLPFFIIEQTVKGSSDSLCLIYALVIQWKRREWSILKLKHIPVIILKVIVKNLCQ